MLETIAAIIVLILCCMGVIELYRSVIFKFFTPEQCKDFIVVVPVYGHDNTLENALRCAQSRTKWFRGRGRVICLNCGMDEETEALCALICDQLKGIEVMTPEEFCRDFSIELQTEGE